MRDADTIMVGDRPDAQAPIVGILTGLLMCLPLWLVIGLAVWLVWFS